VDGKSGQRAAGIVSHERGWSSNYEKIFRYKTMAFLLPKVGIYTISVVKYQLYIYIGW
jgi:hypothetical protein